MADRAVSRRSSRASPEYRRGTTGTVFSIGRDMSSGCAALTSVRSAILIDAFDLVEVGDDLEFRGKSNQKARRTKHADWC